MARVSALQPGEVVRIRDERWRVRTHIACGDAAILDVGGCDHGNAGISAQFLLPIERVERLPTIGAPRTVRAGRWRAAARLALANTVPHVDSLRAAAPADVDVIPFQLEPALAVTRGLGCRLLIADEVGLGKTIQAGLVIAEILERATDGHVLIVSPAGLREQWRHEIEHRFRLRVAVLDAAGLARADSQTGPGGNPWAASPVAITSIDYVKRPEVIRSLESLVWDAIVFDEAHTIAGASERATAAHGLARRARFVVLLSATPHSGDDAAFAGVCRTGELPHEGPLLLFRRTRHDAGLRSSRRTTWLRVRTTAAEARTHDALMDYARLVWRQGGDSAGRLAMAVLVKRAASSASALERSVERRLHLLAPAGTGPCAQPALPFDTATADDEPSILLSAPGLRNPAEERSRLEYILDLARVASRRESKLTTLQRLLTRSGEPAIVFTEYRDTLAHIADILPAVDTVRLHGGLTLSERRESLDAFTSGGARLLLATDAASEGLNLHHRCRLVINMELPWTPLRLEQRVGRVDRIGQRRRVHAVHLVARDTAEEHTVARLLERAARGRTALAPPAPAVDEADIAAAVMGSPGLSLVPNARVADRPSHGQPLRQRFIVPDLRDAAVAEATRISAARLLRDPDIGGRLETRAVITAITRRRGAAPRRYWVFRLTVADSADRLVWSTLLGFETASRRPRMGSTESVRALLQTGGAAIERAVEHQHQLTLRETAATLERFRALGVHRERAIADDLRRHRARLALQPGLFDRRADRTAAAQSAVLDTALERCTRKLAELAALQQLGEGPRDLVFAVVVG